MKTEIDRSYLAARRQLDAMGVERFEVGIRDQAGRMLIRTWDKAKVLESMAWLKRENARGSDVYVRPAGDASAGLVLVDDLNRGQLDRMKAAGLSPASVVETSPDNFQAWVRVDAEALEPKVATEVAKMLATEYGGDPNSADWRHFGRLAGLTNRKPHHKDWRGRSPYVLAHDSGGKTATAGSALVQEAAQRVQEREAEMESRARIDAARMASLRRTSHSHHDSVAVEYYKVHLAGLRERYGRHMDVSRADFMIGQYMAQSGFTPDQIGLAIEQASPKMPTRKAGHEADYVARTVKAIMNSTKVRDWLAQAAARAQEDETRALGDSPRG